LYYPGGSQADAQSLGFDWVNNYWCNLMNITGINGETNPSRPIAIVAMTLLCGSIAIFFYQFAQFFTLSPNWRILVKVGGISSMILAAFMFSEYHDILTIISSLFGLLAVIGVVKSIHQSDLVAYQITGLLCVLLLLINNMIYYSSFGIEWLPLLQKLTFFIVLVWILGVSLEIREKIKYISIESHFNQGKHVE